MIIILQERTLRDRRQKLKKKEEFYRRHKDRIKSLSYLPFTTSHLPHISIRARALWSSSPLSMHSISEATPPTLIKVDKRSVVNFHHTRHLFSTFYCAS